jgi:hypothetical protein
MRATASIFIGLLSMSGCGLPPAVAIGSYAADGVSYLATGKTVTDHGLSAAMDQDCAVIGHLVAGKPVCATKAGRGPGAPVEQGGKSVPAQQVAAIVRDRYVRVGSFLDAEKARRLAARYADAAIVPAEVGGRHFHRVIVGPLSAEDAALLKSRLAAEAVPQDRRG